MTIYEQIKDVLKGKEGQISLSSDIKWKLHRTFGTDHACTIPSDYCYNRINEGIPFDKHIFEYIKRGSYLYLGENYPYTGLIYHKPMGNKVELVAGEWRSGVKILYD